ncbi:MAG: FlgD immunoglobulin-like domain containing protein [bacterium]
MSATIGTAFEGFGFADNPTVNGGFIFIPPDPIAAAGTDRLVAVVNSMIEMRDKTGASLVSLKSLEDFFSPLGGLPTTLETSTFDPKVIYDQFEDRFVVVDLEKTDATDSLGAVDESRILLAVSKTATPATLTSADWYFHAIDSKIDIDLGPPTGIVPHWADYPGFEVDEEAVYITNNMFSFDSFGGTMGGVRLWIVDKGVVGGFYSGGSTTVTVHDPYAPAGIEATTMPAHVFGAGGIPGGTGDIGTFLVSYSSLTAGGPGANESVQVVRVDDPLGASGGPVFTQEFVTVGDIEDVGGVFGFPDLPDAAQLGCSELIEVNDTRALDAVWRDDALWLTTTINPNSGADAGQATAHWFKLSTSAAPSGAITLDDQGDIGGEDIAAMTTTFFPSVAVNSAGDAKFGFSASASTIFAGAYVTGRDAADTPGTVRPSQTVWAGVDSYHRTLVSTDNRWGDYSGISLDPSDDRVFWVFNQFADMSTSGMCEDDGLWGTAYASCTIDTLVVSPPITVDLTPPPGQTVVVPLNLTNPGGLPIDNFELKFLYPAGLLTFQKTDSAGTLTDGWTTASGVENTSGQITITGSNGTPLSSSGVLINVVFQESGGPGTGMLELTNFVNDLAAASTTDAILNNAVPVELASFLAQALANSVKLMWTTTSEINNFGFDIEKSPDPNNFFKIGFVAGVGTVSIPQSYFFIDAEVEPGTFYYRLKQIDTDGSFQHSEILQVDINAPKGFALYQNHPNPFNPETKIHFELPKASNVVLKIYNAIGQEIRTLANSKYEAGLYNIRWDGKDNNGNLASSGVYLYKLQAKEFSQVRKMSLIR